MLQLSSLCNAFSDVDLTLEAGDARVGSVWLSHYTADTASDLLSVEELLVCNLHSAVLVAACSNRLVTGIFVFIQLKVLRSIDFRFEKHVLLVVVLAVDLH